MSQPPAARGRFSLHITSPSSLEAPEKESTTYADLGLEAQNHAAEIKLRAQRRAGEVLQEMEKAKGTRCQLAGREVSGGLSLKPPEDRSTTYTDLGIRKSDAYNWQTIASQPPAARIGRCNAHQRFEPQSAGGSHSAGGTNRALQL
jgi:hypothetical protein